MADNKRDLDMERNAFCFAAAQGDTNGMKAYFKDPGMSDPVYPQVIISALASAVMAEQPETTKFVLSRVEQYRTFPESFVREFFQQDERAHAFINKTVDEYKAEGKALDDERNKFCQAAEAGDVAGVKKYLTTHADRDTQLDMVLMVAFSVAHFGQHMEVAKLLQEKAEKDSTLPNVLLQDMKDKIEGKKPPTLGDNFGPTGKGLNPKR